MDAINIKKPGAFARFHNGEHFNFDKDIVEGIVTDITQVADAVPTYNIYKARVDYESVLFKLSPESKETADITVLNKQRISCWRLITAYLDYYENGWTVNLQKAAKDLQFVLKTYKGLTELNLFEKTGYICDAIEALREASAQPALNAIPGLLPLVNDLEAINIELDGLYIKREQDRGLVHGLGTLSDYRPQVDKAFFDLVGDINSAYRRNELGAKDATLKAAIEKVANTINSLFNKMLDNLAHRGAIGKKNPQKPDITNPEVPGEGSGDNGGEGDGGDGGDGGFQTPDISNPPAPFE